MITQNGFTFRHWANPNSKVVITPFIKSEKYKYTIWRFDSSPYLYLLHQESNRYFEFDNNDQDLTNPKIIELLINTFDQLLNANLLS